MKSMKHRQSKWALGIVASVAATAVAPAAMATPPTVMQLAPGIGGLPIEAGGAGNEQAQTTTYEKNGKRYLVTVYMSSNVSVFEGPWQCKCSSVELSPTEGPKLIVDQKQLTSLQGDRPCNHPRIANDGQSAVFLYTSDHPFQNNVRSYATVLDEQCNVLQQPIRFTENGNANEGASDIVYNGNGLFTGGYLSTGGGQDISFARAFYKSGNTVQLGFLDGVVTPSNIGRPTIVPMSATRSLFCASKGDNRPPEVGVNCAMMDLTTGEELWETTIAASNPYADVYMNQPQAALLDNGQVALMVIESDGRGKNKNKKGSSRTHMFIMQPNDAGPNVTATKDSIGPYQAHATICAGRHGIDGVRRAGLLDASISGSGLATISFMRNTSTEITMDTAKDEWVVGAYNGDSGFISNIFGENPGTQGREFLRCEGDVPNPGYGVTGGFLPNVKSFFAIPYTGRKEGDMKNSLFLSFIPGEVAEPVAPEAPGTDGVIGGTPGGDELTTAVSSGTGAPIAGSGGTGGFDPDGLPGDEPEGFDRPKGGATSGYCSMPAGLSGEGSAIAVAFAALAYAATRRRKEG